MMKKMEKVVLIKHDGNEKQYLFSVPAYMVVMAGDICEVKTKKGKDFGVAVCDSFFCNDIEALMRAWCPNGYYPLAKVVSISPKSIQQYIAKKIIKHIKEEYIHD